MPMDKASAENFLGVTSQKKKNKQTTPKGLGLSATQSKKEKPFKSESTKAVETLMPKVVDIVMKALQQVSNDNAKLYSMSQESMKVLSNNIARAIADKGGPGEITIAQPTDNRKWKFNIERGQSERIKTITAERLS